MGEQAQTARVRAPGPGRGNPNRQQAQRTAILQHLANGHTRTDAAGLCGIARDTLYDWLRVDSTFSDAVTQAELSAVDYHLKCWRDGAKGDWRASMEFLARRRPNDYARKDMLVIMAKAAETAAALSDTELLSLVGGIGDTLALSPGPDGVFAVEEDPGE